MRRANQRRAGNASTAIVAAGAGLVLGVAIGLVIASGANQDELRAENAALRDRLRRAGEHSPAEAPERVRTRPSAANAADSADESALPERPAVPALSDGDVDEMISRAKSARAERRKDDFTAALYELGDTGHPRAQRFLLELAADESLLFPKDTIGDEYSVWLEDSELPGIAKIVRKQFEANWGSPTHRWNAANGWLELVVRHGDKADIDWVASLDRTRRLRAQAYEALAHAAPRHMVRLIDAQRANPANSEHTGKLVFGFARAHPEEAHAYLAPLVRRAVSGEDVGLGLVPNELMQAYGAIVPASELPVLPGLLAGATGEEMRIAGVYLVTMLRSRGLDTSGFGTVLSAPAQTLRRIATEAPKDPGSSHLAYTAMYAVEYNRVAWTEENVLAMERAARELRVGPTDGLAENAKRIRAEMKSDWR